MFMLTYNDVVRLLAQEMIATALKRRGVEADKARFDSLVEYAIANSRRVHEEAKRLYNMIQSGELDELDLLPND
jgi:hypothetical protein